MKKIVGLGICILVFLVVKSVATSVYQSQQDVKNAYLLWWTGSIVGDSIDSGEFERVHTIDDLHPAYERVVLKRGDPWKFEDIRDRVVIDFAKIKSDLSNESPSPSFDKYVWLRGSSRYTTWSGADPNDMIRERIIAKLTQATEEPVENLDPNNQR